MIAPARRTIVSVIGAGEATAEESAAAHEVGERLARRGAVVVTGGLGGVMAAACRGAREAGGETIGILPGERPGDANEWVGIPLPTGLGEARNVLVATAGAGVIAVGGALGTLSEIAHALRRGRPVVTLGSWDIAALAPGALRSGAHHTPLAASSPEEAVARLWEELALERHS